MADGDAAAVGAPADTQQPEPLDALAAANAALTAGTSALARAIAHAGGARGADVWATPLAEDMTRTAVLLQQRAAELCGSDLQAVPPSSPTLTHLHSTIAAKDAEIAALTASLHELRAFTETKARGSTANGSACLASELATSQPGSSAGDHDAGDHLHEPGCSVDDALSQRMSAISFNASEAGTPSNRGDGRPHMLQHLGDSQDDVGYHYATPDAHPEAPPTGDGAPPLSLDSSTPDTVPASSPSRAAAAAASPFPPPDKLVPPAAKAVPKSPRGKTAKVGTTRRRSQQPAPPAAPVMTKRASMMGVKSVKTGPTGGAKLAPPVSPGVKLGPARSDAENYESLKESFLRSRVRIQELERELGRLKKEREAATAPTASPGASPNTSLKLPTSSQEVAQLRERIRHLERVSKTATTTRVATDGALQEQLKAREAEVNVLNAELQDLRKTSTLSLSTASVDGGSASASLKEKESEVAALAAKVSSLQEEKRSMEIRMALSHIGPPGAGKFAKGRAKGHADPVAETNGTGEDDGDADMSSLKASLKKTQEEAESLRKEVAALQTSRADAELASAAASRLHQQLRKKDAICEGLKAQNATLQLKVRTLQSPNGSPRPEVGAPLDASLEGDAEEQPFNLSAPASPMPSPLV